MKRIEINFKPTDTDVKTAVAFTKDNLNALAAAGVAGDPHALRLWAAYEDYTKGRDESGCWITHFYTVYNASREVQS